MKTILVLTDFSINADYTAHYALKLAQKIKANLLLCNIYTAPDEAVYEGRKSWPLGAREVASINDLGEIAARLKTAIDLGDQIDFRPEVDQFSKKGLIIDVINDFVSSHHIFLAIISVHNPNSFSSSSFLSNDARDIIDEADFPVLLIPYQVRFKNYKTIAFATDLTITDKYVLNSIAGLAKYSAADILITHVVNKSASVEVEESHLKEFFSNEVSGKSSPIIHYQALRNGSVTNALKELTQDASVDMLVLIKRPRNFFEKIFDKNVISRMSDHPAKPLLIFPNTNVLEKLPVF
jgi:nucleotide-binding universal stress UspA family protein